MENILLWGLVEMIRKAYPKLRKCGLMCKQCLVVLEQFDMLSY